MKYPLPVQRALWDKVLSYARKYDVEEGETNEYIYAVRQTTGTVTLWTRAGWAGGFYVARITPEKWQDLRKRRLTLTITAGECPPDQAWPEDVLINHIAGLLGRAEASSTP